MGNATYKHYSVTEAQVYCKVEHTIAGFDVLRHNHRFCVDASHYVVWFDGMLFILHPDELEETDGEILMSVVEVHGAYISESQRATLRSRLKVILKGSP